MKKEEIYSITALGVIYSVVNNEELANKIYKELELGFKNEN